MQIDSFEGNSSSVNLDISKIPIVKLPMLDTVVDNKRFNSMQRRFNSVKTREPSI